MAAKPLDIHPAALAELKSAVVWYDQRSESAGDAFVAQIDHAIDLITADPKRWPQGERGTRRFVLSRFPYAVVYYEKPTTIQILAFAHGHRSPGYWEGRL
ncbi:MAG: type II toxin-antitoxin system RelE/ParE family toxin [Terriglobales bacterium]